jgi:hypothetical protein
MTAATVTGQGVFEAISRDRTAKRTLGGDDGLKLLRADIEALPVILADGLDAQVTLARLQDAQVAFLDYVLEKGALEGFDATGIGDALFAGLAGAFSLFGGGSETTSEPKGEVDPEVALKSELASKLGLLRDTLKMFDADDMLALAGTTGTKILQGRKSPLDRKAKKLARRGELTFAELLRVQPTAFIVEPSDG